MKIGIIVAMEKELAQLTALLQDGHTVNINGKPLLTGRIGKHDVVLQQCGIGKVNAAMGTTQLITHCQPDVVLSTGVAGGADISLHVGEMVVGTSFVYHDVYCGSECAYGQLIGQPARYEASPLLLDTLMKVETAATLRPGLIVTGDWFVDSADKMREILSHFPEAMAVDMESCAIAHVCHEFQIPFASLRLISDIPLSDHKAAQYYDFWERLADTSFQVVRQLLSDL